MNFCAVTIRGAAAAASTVRAAKKWPETAPPTKAAARVRLTNPIRSLMVMVAVSFPVPKVRRFSGRTLAGFKGGLQKQRTRRKGRSGTGFNVEPAWVPHLLGEG